MRWSVPGGLRMESALELRNDLAIPLTDADAPSQIHVTLPYYHHLKGYNRLYVKTV